MRKTYNIALKTLHAIYDKHRRKYRGNPDSNQMCCMWSTNYPPDTLIDTQPILDIENAFNIEIHEHEAVKLYDMYLDDAAKMILELKSKYEP